MKRSFYHSTRLIFLACLCSLTTFAQTEDKYEISTDRPSVSFTANVAPKGILIAENGYYWQTYQVETGVVNSTLTNRLSTMPNISLRYGILNNVELRLGWDYRRSENIFKTGAISQSQVVQGSNALTLGTKIKITENEGAIPQATFLGAIQLPFTADKNFKNNYIGQYFRFLFQNKLNDKFFLFYNLGADFGTDAQGTAQTAGAYTFALGSNIAPGLTGFVELFGFMPERAVDTHSIDAGLVYVLSKQYQLDASVGYGLTKYAPDWFFNVGFSFYLNTKK